MSATASASRIAELEYELGEARSEIDRHHMLIERLSDGLGWTLDMLDVEPERADEWRFEHTRAVPDSGRRNDLRLLLNRAVG